MKFCVLGMLLLLAALPMAAQEPDQPSLGGISSDQVVQYLVSGQFPKIEAEFDANMASALPPGKLATAWAALIQQAGPFQSIVETQPMEVVGHEAFDVVCKFEKVTLDFHIAFDPDGKIAGLHFHPHLEPLPPWAAPSYAKPDSFTELPLTLVNGKYELPGTLTLPNGDGPFPAIVLVAGSGPSDEDESIAAEKPFKDLAWGLASHGVAVFRYMKRTLKYGAKSSDDPTKLTVNDETMSDARAAVALLAKQPKIDPAHVFLLGHSLGGYLAPRIAAGDAQIAGIILLGANVLPVEQLIPDQVRYVVSATGTPAEQGQKEIAAADAFEKQVESPDLKPEDKIDLFGSTSYGAYWLDLRAYHPVEAAAQLKIPILILQGGRDYQTTMANFQQWSKLADHKNVTLKSYPDLDHLFITGTGPSKPQDYQKPGHVAGEVITDIAAWITANGNPAK